MSNVLLRVARCAGAAALVGVIGISGSALAATRHPGSGGATPFASSSASSAHLGGPSPVARHERPRRPRPAAVPDLRGLLDDDHGELRHAHAQQRGRVRAGPPSAPTGVVSVKVEKTLRKLDRIALDPAKRPGPDQPGRNGDGAARRPVAGRDDGQRRQPDHPHVVLLRRGPRLLELELLRLLRRRRLRAPRGRVAVLARATRVDWSPDGSRRPREVGQRSTPTPTTRSS